MNLNFPIKNRRKILALGAEFDTRLGFYFDGKIIFSDNIGELAEDEAGYEEFAREFASRCRRQIELPPAISKPDLIITDSHPLYTSRKAGERLAAEWGIEHISVQHHIAHIFSSFGDWIMQVQSSKFKVQSLGNAIYGIACDGTGYGSDGNIWGGEVFNLSVYPPLQRGIPARLNSRSGRKWDFSNGCPRELNDTGREGNAHGKIPPNPPLGKGGTNTPYPPNPQAGSTPFIKGSNPAPYPPAPPATSSGQALWERGEIKRIGHLEEQCLLGGELAVEEPARMLISILSKFLPKDEVFKYVSKYYNNNEFDLLWNQLQQKFNCPLSSSTGRVLDAVSILLGFCGNERKYKHYPVKMLEENSKYSNFNASLGKGSDPFEGGQTPRMRAANLNGSQMPPQIEKDKSEKYILNTTDLFKYLVENINSDKRQLGKLAQRYIIEGLYEIVKIYESKGKPPLSHLLIKEWKLKSAGVSNLIFFSGGLAANRVMKEFAEEHGIYVSAKIPPGDEGIALGQIIVNLNS